MANRATRLPLRGLRFVLVGPGRVGRSLAGWLGDRGARLVRLGVRDGEAAVRRANAWLERRDLGRVPVTTVAQLESGDADLLLLTVPDGTLRPLSTELARRPQAVVALHAAGALGAEAIAPLRRGGVEIGTLHPLAAFPRPRRRPPRGIVFAIGGDPAAAALGRRLALACGGEAAEVAGGQRLAYHLGATLAAGGVLTLLAEAASIAREAGLPDAVLRGYRQLLLGAVAAADPLAPAAAITGPVARGDHRWLRRQAAALSRRRERLRLVLAVARATVALRSAAGASGAADELRCEIDRLAKELEAASDSFS